MKTFRINIYNIQKIKNNEDQLRIALCGQSRGCEELHDRQAEEGFPDREPVRGERSEHGLLHVRQAGGGRCDARGRDAPPGGHRPAQTTGFPDAPRVRHLQRGRPRHRESGRRNLRARLQGGVVPGFGRARSLFREQGQGQPRQILFQLRNGAPQLSRQEDHQGQRRSDGAGIAGNLQPPQHQQDDREPGAGDLPAADGDDRTGNGKRVEHHAGAHPLAPHGGLLLF